MGIGVSIKRYLLLLSVMAVALTPATRAFSQPTTISQQLAEPSIAPNADPATATKAWLDTVPAEQRAKTDAYFEGGYWLLLWNFLMVAAIALWLLYSGFSARLRDLAERRTRIKALQVVWYTIPFLFIVWLLSGPLAIYQDYYREHAYGFANQNFAQWFGEQLKALLVTLILGSILLVALYAAFRRAPNSWWIWGTIIAIFFAMVGSFLAPVFIEPLFNNYKPLRDPAISEPILVLARANEIPVTQVFEVDASRQSNRVSANVAGFLGTTRIALNDNLLKQCKLPEIRAVMGHEMGHYVLNHTTKHLVNFALLFLAVFALLKVSFDFGVSRWGQRWGVHGIADPAGLPLLMLIISALFLLLTPVTNTITRTMEREADIFGINTSREAKGMAKVALKLGAYRKLDPTPLEEFIFFDHPSGRARIRMAMDWKAAHLPAGPSQ